MRAEFTVTTPYKRKNSAKADLINLRDIITDLQNRISDLEKENEALKEALADYLILDGGNKLV